MLRIILGTYHEKKFVYDTINNRNPLEVIPIMNDLGMQYNPDTMVFWDPTRDLECWEIEEYMDKIVEDSEDSDYIMFTNCPLMLNWMEDNVAKESVYLTAVNYNNIDIERIKIKPFFSIPSMVKQLSYIGPGEVFNNSNMLFHIMELREGTNGDIDLDDDIGYDPELEGVEYDGNETDIILEQPWEEGD